MAFGLIYLILLIIVCSYVFISKYDEAIISMSILIVGSLMTLIAAVMTGRFENFSIAVLAVDAFILIAFMAHALTSSKYWPMLLPSFQIITCATHLAKLFSPEMLPRVYSAGQGFWAYPILLVIFLAAKWKKNQDIYLEFNLDLQDSKPSSATRIRNLR